MTNPYLQILLTQQNYGAEEKKPSAGGAMLGILAGVGFLFALPFMAKSSFEQSNRIMREQGNKRNQRDWAQMQQMQGDGNVASAWSTDDAPLWSPLIHRVDKLKGAVDYLSRNYVNTDALTSAIAGSPVDILGQMEEVQIGRVNPTSINWFFTGLQRMDKKSRKQLLGGGSDANDVLNLSREWLQQYPQSR